MVFASRFRRLAVRIAFPWDSLGLRVYAHYHARQSLSPVGSGQLRAVKIAERPMLPIGDGVPRKNRHMQSFRPDPQRGSKQTGD